MRLRQHLNEKTTLFGILQVLYAKSLPFVKEFIKEVGPHTESQCLYSGRTKKSGHDYFESDIRTNRRPQDTPENVHNYADQLFYKQFKVKARSQSLFCTGSYDMADRYGRVYGIWPQGKYKYIWSPIIKDFFLVIEKEAIYMNDVDEWDVDGYNSEREARDQIEEDKRFIENLVNTKYTDKYLGKAISSGHEIMVSAKSYLAIEDAHLPFVFLYMDKFGTKMPTKELVASLQEDAEEIDRIKYIELT